MSQHVTIPAMRRPVQSALGVRATLRAIANEGYKGMLAAWGERVQILIELILFIATALLLAAVVGRGEEIATGRVNWSLDEERTTWIFLGFAAFMFYYLQTAKIFWRLLGEIQTGTLEQVHLSPLPSWVIAIAGGVVAAVIETTVVIASVYLAVELVAGLNLHWRVEGLLPILFLVTGAAGYSLVIGGLVLVWKRIELVNEGLFAVLFMFGGLFVPLEQMPGWAAAITRLFPLFHATQSLRGVLLDGRSVTTMWGDGDLAWLTVTTVAWLMAGTLVFRLGEQTAKRRGTLSRY